VFRRRQRNARRGACVGKVGLTKQLGQLGDVGGDAPGLVAGEQLGRRAAGAARRSGRAHAPYSPGRHILGRAVRPTTVRLGTPARSITDTMFSGSVLPEIFEPRRRQLGIAHRVTDVAMPEVNLQSLRIVAFVGERVAAGMPHMCECVLNASLAAVPARSTMRAKPHCLYGPAGYESICQRWMNWEGLSQCSLNPRRK
jgi:hypothetical protein